ncbi:MAG: quinate/shikimate dehydrogenase [Candidatus Schmidhempelia sp.]|nr:quinate/shikimate dehydrogenase [Candidatus Schmidhempelia sp.]
MKENIDAHTQLIGLLAYPIRHSLAPIIQNRVYAKLNIPYAYLAFEVTAQKLPEAIRGIRALGMKGAAISMPNKQLVCQYLDKITPAVELSGACNTITNDDGILTGYNTDGSGYMRSLKEAGINIIGKKIMLIGAGGAATAIAAQAALDGVKEIALFNQKDIFYPKAEALATRINQKTSCKVNVFDLADNNALQTQIADSYLLAHATGIGMKPYERQNVITDASIFHPNLIVTDCIYVPRKTPFLALAERQGCYILNGINMMLWQGIEQIKIWTGQDIRIDDLKQNLNFDNE